jgi:hypothetical protein
MDFVSALHWYLLGLERVCQPLGTLQLLYLLVAWGWNRSVLVLYTNWLWSRILSLKVERQLFLKVYRVRGQPSLFVLVWVKIVWNVWITTSYLLALYRFFSECPEPFLGLIQNVLVAILSNNLVHIWIPLGSIVGAKYRHRSQLQLTVVCQSLIHNLLLVNVVVKV